MGQLRGRERGVKEGEGEGEGEGTDGGRGVDSKQRVAEAENEATGAERTRMMVRRESARESVTA